MNNKGSTLLMTLTVVIVLAVLGVSFGGRIINDSTITRKNVSSTQAFWVAEGGLQQVVWDYDHNQCHGMRNAATGVPCDSCASCGSGPRLYTGTLGNGTFSVTCLPSTKTYVSTGSVWQGATLLAQRKIKVFFGQDFILGSAAFSQADMTIKNGSHIDSYNSDHGTYAATVSDQGNIGTNGTTVTVIDIGNNSVIHGAVTTGPGGTVGYNPAKVSISGGVADTNDVYIEPVSVPSDVQAATAFPPLVVSGTTTLTAGRYSYPSIDLGNDGTLNISGEVKIYLTGSSGGLTSGNNVAAFNLLPGASVVIYSEGIVNIGNKVEINNHNAIPKPSDFQIYSLYSGSNGVYVGNKNTFVGTVYAPLTDVMVKNNGDFFGAIVGNTVELGNNGALHYDEALASLRAPWQPAEPRDWQEQFD